MALTKTASHGESGFTLIDLLFTASLICTLCTMALPSLYRARGAAQSASAVSTLRVVNSAQLSFAVACGSGFYSPDFMTLGAPPVGAVAAFLPAELATGASFLKQGYTFAMNGTPLAGAPATCNGRAAGSSRDRLRRHRRSARCDGQPVLLRQQCRRHDLPAHVDVQRRDAGVGAAADRRPAQDQLIDLILYPPPILEEDPCTFDVRAARRSSLALLHRGRRPCPAAQTKAPAVTSPKQFFGFNIGDDYQLATYDQFIEYWHKIDKESNRMQVVEIGKTRGGAAAAGRDHHRAGELRQARSLQADRAAAAPRPRHQRRAGARAGEGRQGGRLDRRRPARDRSRRRAPADRDRRISWSAAPTTRRLRILRDVIIIAVHANPDGMQMVSKCYMQNDRPAGSPHLQPAPLQQVRGARRQPRLLHVEPRRNPRT